MLSNYLTKIFMWMSCLLTILFEATSHSSPIVWNVPGRNLNFVGREQILKEIDKSFKEGKSKTVVLTGLSAFGKSQIAKQYVHSNYYPYQIVWWFKGNQYLTQQFENFAAQIVSELKIDVDINSVGHGKLIQIINDIIRKRVLKCLIIFDDIQSYTDIEMYVPFTHENNIDTLITSKNSNFSNKVIHVGPFTPEESTQYISLFLPKEKNISKTKLATHLEGCPTSIALAVDYIKSFPGMSIDEYLASYGEIDFSPTVNVQEIVNKLESPIDGYKMDLLNAIKINIRELKEKSILAYQVIGFLSILHHDALGTDIIKSWLINAGSNQDVLSVVTKINQYSLIDTESLPQQGKGNIRMHELVQKIISVLILPEEKKQYIDQAIKILTPIFNERSDVTVGKILKDNAPFLHALKISEEAHKLNYHTAKLSSLRVKILDVLVGIIRDFKKAEMINDHLLSDFSNNIKLELLDEILYNSNLFLFSFIYSPDFDKAIIFGKKAYQLIEKKENVVEEKLRLISNLIQYYSLTGQLDEAQKYAEKGEELFPYSKSLAYNALYVLALSTFHNEKGNFDGVVDLFKHHEDLLKQQHAYPSMYSFTLNQLCEALVKKNTLEEAQKTLVFTEKIGKEFYANEENNFFAKLKAMFALAKFDQSDQFAYSLGLLKDALETYNKIYCGDERHKNQGSIHSYIAKLYYLNKDYKKAKDHALLSNKIYDKILKGKKVYDVGELYKLLALIGIELKDESLFEEFFRKNINIFGIDHPNTLLIAKTADERGIPLPH